MGNCWLISDWQYNSIKLVYKYRYIQCHNNIGCFAHYDMTELKVLSLIFIIHINDREIQERLKRRNNLSCLDQYAAQNDKYARPPIPSQTPTQKVFFHWRTQYDPTMKHSHCETVHAKELFQWLFFELVHSLRILSILPTFKPACLTKECQWCT